MELKWILQIIGVVLGLLYLYLEYKANIYLWVVGLIMPFVHGILYYKSGLYADFGMEIYYILAGIYGWAVWRNAPCRKKYVEISHTPIRLYARLLLMYVLIHIAIYYILITYTNSRVPILDSFTTALSVVAYWMLSRKYIEQWLVWLVVDMVTVGLYIYKEIPLTASLYALYTILAMVGYWRWNKILNN